MKVFLKQPEMVGVSQQTIKNHLVSGELLKSELFIGANRDMPLPQSNFRKSNNSAAMSIIVTNVNTGENLDYISIYEASKKLGISRPTLKRYLDTGKCFKNTYILKYK